MTTIKKDIIATTPKLLMVEKVDKRIAKILETFVKVYPNIKIIFVGSKKIIYTYPISDYIVNVICLVLTKKVLLKGRSVNIFDDNRTLLMLDIKIKKIKIRHTHEMGIANLQRIFKFFNKHIKKVRDIEKNTDKNTFIFSNNFSEELLKDQDLLAFEINDPAKAKNNFKGLQK